MDRAQLRSGDADRLLIIEERACGRASLTDLLSDDASRRFEVTCVSCTAEALCLVRSDMVTVVLLDLGVADTGGLEAIKLIHQERPGVPIVVLTGSQDGDLAMRAIQSGAQDYLVRGTVSAAEILRSLQYAMERADGGRVTARLAAIIESSHDAVISVTVDHIISTWNKGAENLFGYRAEEVVGRSVSLIVPSDRLGEFCAVLDRVVHGESLEHFETRRVRKDGREFDASLQLSPLVVSGRVVGVSGIARDISDQKRVERTLRESEGRLAEAQRMARVGSWSFDFASHRLECSDELYRVLGWQPGDVALHFEWLLGRLHHVDAEQIRNGCSSFRFEKAFETEHRLILRDGSQRWLVARMEAQIGGNAVVVGLHGTVQDITERRAAEERQRLQAHLLDAVGESVIAVDLRGDIMYWGPGAEKLYRWTAAETLGRSNVIAVSRSQSEATELKRQLLAGGSWSGIVKLERRDGSSFLAELRTTPVVGDHGQIEAVIGISTDVSDRQQARLELEWARDQAEEASMAKTNFLATVSHEIRTPMNGLLGMTELLLDTDLDGAQRAYAEAVWVSVEDLLRTLNQILEFSKVSA